MEIGNAFTDMLGHWSEENVVTFWEFLEKLLEADLVCSNVSQLKQHVPNMNGGLSLMNVSSAHPK